MPGFLGIKGGTLMDPEQPIICVEVTPSSHGFDSAVYPWDRVSDALNDAELTLDGAEDASVTLRIVKKTQAEIDAMVSVED